MSPRTSLKLAIFGVISIFFAGFILRAAVRLASAAMHSMFVALLLVLVAAWAVAKLR